MKLIIPMAGLGKRMRPFTLTTPKPLLKVAGKSIVQRIIEDLNTYSGRAITEVHYVIGDFGTEVEKELVELAKVVNASGHIHYQRDALGTAHAVFSAEEALKGEVVIAFADTLYGGNISISDSDEAIIWTYEVKNPESYGVLVEDSNHNVTDFVEKPKEFISNKAIVGMYYFKDGLKLHNCIKDLMDNERMTSGEYQLTDALKDLKKEGLRYTCKTLSEWLDFGNPQQFLTSAEQVLRNGNNNKLSNVDGVTIVEPVYIGKNVVIQNSTLGPNVIVEDNTEVIGCLVESSIIGAYSSVKNSELKLSMVGNQVKMNNFKGSLKMGDYNEIH